MLAATPGAGRAGRTRGVFSVEFALVMFVSMLLFAMAGEFLRLSLMDQMLARVTHLGVRAAANAASDTACEAAVKNVFENDVWALWLFDRNGDGEFAGVVTGAGSGNGAEEVQVNIVWDDPPYDGVDDSVAGSCGAGGSWLKVRSEISVQPWFFAFRAVVPDGIPVYHESWGRTNR